MDHYTLPWKFPESVPLSLRDLIGRPVRTVRPGEVITLEYIAGRVTFFLDEPDVVLLLELQHFVLAGAQILFDLNQLLGDRGGDVAALVGAHAFLHVEILLHHRV